MFVDKAGTQAAVLDDNDFYPWGGVVPGVGVSSSNNHYKFTGKERDSESNLDYFGARYYANVIGRFMSPDWAAKPTSVPYAEFGDPQSLNLYSYVRNSPIVRVDADGHSYASWNGFNADKGGEQGHTELDSQADFEYAHEEAGIAWAEAARAADKAAQQQQVDAANQYVQAGVDNAKNASQEFSQQKLSDTCVAFLNQLGAGAPIPFNAASLQAQAAASASFVFDGASSPSTLFSVGASGSGTVGTSFQNNSGTNAMSPPVGNAVFVRSAAFASTNWGHNAYVGANGKPTGYAKSVMAHEMMHKFGDVHPNLENRLGAQYANAARDLGSMAVSRAIMEKCQ